ncbi:hypothetical protein IV203_015528 [Nitzschia inconspicua]|uniref:Uncharacterized protein n=1 Tax=Nitzschia inconspicua TaxID=303405 RepID=A0A9K3LAY8_9STRA|nr:hypothetical protein IV203_015528 [Nitzschia inconspicua]
MLSFEEEEGTGDGTTDSLSRRTSSPNKTNEEIIHAMEAKAQRLEDSVKKHRGSANNSLNDTGTLQRHPEKTKSLKDKFGDRMEGCTECCADCCVGCECVIS